MHLSERYEQPKTTNELPNKTRERFYFIVSGTNVIATTFGGRGRIRIDDRRRLEEPSPLPIHATLRLSRRRPSGNQFFHKFPMNLIAASPALVKFSVAGRLLKAMRKQHLPLALLDLPAERLMRRRTSQASLTQIHKQKRVPGGLRHKELR